MKAILPLYLTGSLGFSQSRSTTLIHSFNFSAYFSLYSVGSCLILCWEGTRQFWCFRWFIVLEWPYWLDHLSHLSLRLAGFWLDWCLWHLEQVELSLAYLLSRRPFNPAQIEAISTYFSIFFSLLMRKCPFNVHYADNEAKCSLLRTTNCYPLAFGLPAGLMFIATVFSLLDRQCT